jgi:thymidylate synthase (FAD)
MIEVTYISHMGDDLAVVNAARVSFAKMTPEFRMQDAKLLGYLARNGHWTPFAHPQLSVHVTAPIFVARQCFKHKVGLVENEVSRRYVDAQPAMYQPRRWRGRAEDKKQGCSELTVAFVQLEPEGERVPPTLLAEDCYRTCLATYEAMIRGGVAPEQARMVLPQAMMTEWIWTGSLAAFARFSQLRQGRDAQAETGEVAWRCADILERCFPVSWAALNGAAMAQQSDAA